MTIEKEGQGESMRGSLERRQINNLTDWQVQLPTTTLEINFGEDPQTQVGETVADYL